MLCGKFQFSPWCSFTCFGPKCSAECLSTLVPSCLSAEAQSFSVFTTRLPRHVTNDIIILIKTLTSIQVFSIMMINLPTLCINETECVFLILFPMMGSSQSLKRWTLSKFRPSDRFYFIFKCGTWDTNLFFYS